MLLLTPSLLLQPEPSLMMPLGTSLAPEGDIINAQYRLTPCTSIVQAGVTYKARGLFNLSHFPHPSGRDLMNAQTLDGLLCSNRH